MCIRDSYGCRWMARIFSGRLWWSALCTGCIYGSGLYHRCHVLSLIHIFAIAVWTAIKEFFVSAWEAISNAAQTIWNGIKNFFSALWEGIKTIFNTVLNVIKTIVTTYFNVYKTIITTVFNAIKTCLLYTSRCKYSEYAGRVAGWIQYIFHLSGTSTAHWTLGIECSDGHWG